MTTDQHSGADARASLGRIGRVAGALVGARAVFALVNLAAIAVAARVVGLEEIGAVGILLAFSRLLGDAAKFDSWKALIRYGAEYRKRSDRAGLARLTGLLLCLDAAAMGAALIAAYLLPALLGAWLGWTEAMRQAAPWFMLAIIFMTHMTPTGLLRLEGRFFAIGAHHALTACFRLLGAIWIYFAGGGFAELAMVWVAAAVLAGGALWLSAAASAQRQFGRPDFSAPLQQSRNLPGFWGFAGVTNITSTLNGAPGPLATLAVGAVLGPSEAGVFHLVRQVAEALQRPAEQLGQAAFPEFANLAASEKRAAMRRVVWRSLLFSMAAAAFGAVLLHVFGAGLLGTLFGEAAVSGAAALTLAGGASLLQAAAFTLEPALMTTGRHRVILTSQIIAFIAFCGTLALMLEPCGLIGVGAALMVFRSIQILWRVLVLRNSFKTDT